MPREAFIAYSLLYLGWVSILALAIGQFSAWVSGRTEVKIEGGEVNVETDDDTSRIGIAASDPQ